MADQFHRVELAWRGSGDEDVKFIEMAMRRVAYSITSIDILLVVDGEEAVIRAPEMQSPLDEGVVR